MIAASRIHYESRVSAVGLFYAHRFIRAQLAQRQKIECRADAMLAALALPESQLPLIRFLAHVHAGNPCLHELFGSLAGSPPVASPSAPAGNLSK